MAFYILLSIVILGTGIVLYFKWEERKWVDKKPLSPSWDYSRVKKPVTKAMKAKIVKKPKKPR